MRCGWILAALLAAGCSGATPMTPSPSSVPASAPVPLPLPTRGPQFDQVFWNEFVYNGFDSPSALQTLRRLTAAPMLYLKTVDEAGQPIDALTLDTVQNAMVDVAATWGGGQFGLAGVQRGTSSMAGVSGWVTVVWSNPSIGALCGRSTVGVDGGSIELNYRRQDIGCGCNGSKMRTRTARHELGHAFGYWHTDSDADLMKNNVNGCADSLPSARETYHATVAYQTPVGSSGFLALHAAPITIID